LMENVRSEVLKVVKSDKPWGIDVIDVRMTRADYVDSITESVYRRMEAERKRVANELRSTGAAEGEKIRADADRQREVTLANAYRDAQKIKGEGDAEAAHIYAESFGRDPQFAQFYRSLEAYKSTFAKKSDLMVLDPSSDFFKALRGSGSGASAPAKKISMDSDVWWAALGLMLVVEGLFPFISPTGWRNRMQQLLALQDGQIRFFGLALVLVGLLLLWWP